MSINKVFGSISSKIAAIQKGGMNEELIAKMQEVLDRQDAILKENADLKKQLAQQQVEMDRLSVNPNFGCYVRGAMEMQVGRRVQDGVPLALIALDVAGMGRANSLKGESWVNEQITLAIKHMRATLRSTDQICGQLNSGDEFIVMCPLGDMEMVKAKVEEAFNLYHLNPDIADTMIGSYCVAIEYDHSVPFCPRQGSPTEDANTSRAMEKVYELKVRLNPDKYKKA